VQLYARVHQLGLLPAEERELIASELEDAALERFDASFINEEELLALIPPTRIVRLTNRLLGVIEDVAQDRVDEMIDEASSSSEGADFFDDMRGFLKELEEAFADNGPARKSLRRMLDKIKDAVDQLDDAAAEASDNAAADTEWDAVAPAKVVPVVIGRSVFSDVDS
jgi:hypothetical protein